MNNQTGYVFHRGPSWFLRYYDNVRQDDGSIKRVQVCAKLPVPYGGQYRSVASVSTFVQDILAPINSGMLTPHSTMPVIDFVEQVFFPDIEKHVRKYTVKNYRHLWTRHLRDRIGTVLLRDFRTVHAARLIEEITRPQTLGKSTISHLKNFLSGVFKAAKNLGYLDGINPITGLKIPRGLPVGETHAYNLTEVNKMLLVLKEPVRTVVLTAALTGMRKSEIRGLRWADFNGKELSVKRSVVESDTNDTKNKSSNAPIPVVKLLADALEAHRLEMGKLATPSAPIFQAGNGKPLNLNNVAKRLIVPSLLDSGVEWHGWHSFRRGLATTLHQLHVDDKTISAICRHSSTLTTMNIYVKSVSESQVSAMDTLSAELEKREICNNSGTTSQLVN